MKREYNDNDDDEQRGNSKRVRRNDETVRILIPSRIAGAVIGKGGQHIQKLRFQYKCTVCVDDSQGPERTILISSDYDSILKILREMLKYFEEKDREYDIRMLIHQSLAGRVIGKGGSKIKEIRDKVGCRILKVFPCVAPESTDRIVQIFGKAEPCISGVGEVLDIIKNIPIKGSIHNYDPNNSDERYTEDYGGFVMSGNNNNGNRGRNRQQNDRGGRFNKSGGGGGGGEGGDHRRYDDRNRNDIRRDREYINPWANDMPLGNMGNNMNSGYNMNFGNPNMFLNPEDLVGFLGKSANFCGLFNVSGNTLSSEVEMGNMNPNNMSGNEMNKESESSVNSDNKESTQVTIPKDLAGAIIGKGGGRIKRIRNESGAYITIDEPLPGSNDRIITITGTQKQIQMAQYLLQKSVQENRQKF